MKEEDLGVMKVKLLAKQKSLQCKKDSLYRYQDLLKATIATSPDLASVKECYGKDWFKPDWNRCISLYSTYTCILTLTHNMCLHIDMCLYPFAWVRTYVYQEKLCSYTYICTYVSDLCTLPLICAL